jgi:tRNA threonylcarbamoyladenosine biosynthesis protein TsaE
MTVSSRMISHSEEATRRIGAQLATQFAAGDIIALRGLLGAGKSVFVRGIAEGLGISPRKVRSPTFTLINEYSGGRLPLFHLDLYRIEPSEIDRMALREYLYGSGVCVVEWWERLGQSDNTVDVEITFVGTSERLIVVSSNDPRYEAVLARLNVEMEQLCR